ncbi:MAG: HlyD family efflux transporter periplasmic adaptor subunit [Acidobacteria bacterium]|nr:HlyD family efflux transporter periplasmic adaptor subunit [Acidobacteriota bacterium]
MPKPNKKILFPIFIIIIALVLYFTIFSNGNDETYIVSGTVEAREIDISPKIAGRIDAILAEEGDYVKKGQLLLQMDDRQLKIQVQRAEAALNIAEQQFKDLEAGARKEEIAAAKASVSAAEAAVKKAASDLKRAKELFNDEAASKDFLEKAELQMENSQKNLDVAWENLKLIKAGARSNVLESAKFRVNEAKRAMDEVMLLQTDSRTFSPINGIVTVRSAEPGEIIGAGTPVLTVINPADCYLKIYISEKILGNIKLGRKAKIYSDSHPDKTFEGTLTFLSSEAEFTPRNIQTKDERVKLMFAAKVAIDNSDFIFKPGMPVDVEFDISGE